MPPLDPKNGSELNDRIRAEYQEFGSYESSSELLKAAFHKEMLKDDPEERRATLEKINEKVDRMTRSGTSTPSVRRVEPRPARPALGKMSDEMRFPATPSTGRDINKRLMEDMSPTQFASTRTIRSSPMVGRTINLNPDKGIDFGRGLTLLQQRVVQSRIPQTLYKQRFHERPGLKRKRLKSERWRRYFKQGFDAMVTRVKQMKAQGW